MSEDVSKPYGDVISTVPPTGIAVQAFRWVKVISPNGTPRDELEYQVVGSDKWVEIPRSGITRKEEWA
jgi:hypothetical protein